MSEPFIGQITLFAGNFAPRGWALCDGQLLPISQNQSLYSILGTIYGGDGRTNFALPDLRGRTPVHAGSGPGLTTRRPGDEGGFEEVRLRDSEIPAHSHSASGVITCSSQAGTSDSPDSKFPAGSSEGDQIYANAGRSKMAEGSVTVDVANSGGNQPHTNMQPFTCINYIIALVGVYPSRN